MKCVAAKCSTSKTTGPGCRVKRSVWVAPLPLSTSDWDIGVAAGGVSAVVMGATRGIGGWMDVGGAETTGAVSTGALDAGKVVRVCAACGAGCGGAAVRDNGGGTCAVAELRALLDRCSGVVVDDAG